MFASKSLIHQPNKQFKSLILLFLTIILWLWSVMVLADLDIQTNIQNARQTIQRVTITSNWTDAGTKLIDFNNDASKIFISTAILNAQTSFSGNVLWLNADGELIYVPSSGLIVSWATYSNTPWWTGNDTYWTGSLDDIRNTNIGNVNIGAGTATGRLYVWSTADTQLVLEEGDANKAANMWLKNTVNTRKIGWYSNLLYIGNNSDIWFTITPSGNVGIGIGGNAATRKLEVNWDTNITGSINVHNDTRWGNQYKINEKSIISSMNTNSGAVEFLGINSYRSNGRQNDRTWLYVWAKSYIKFVLGWTSVMTISGNNVGIDTDNPSNKLHVVGTGQFDHLKITALTNTCLGADGAWNVVGTGCGSTSTSTWSSLWTASTNGIYYNSWNVGIGMTPAAWTNKLQVSGDVLVTGTNGYVTASAYYYNSDKNLKKNISPIASALEKINALNGYMFTWRSNNRNDMWVIAQEVETVFPEIVNTDIAGYKSVEYGNLVAPLIEAIKELSKKVEQQAKEIEQLKNR